MSATIAAPQNSREIRMLVLDTTGTTEGLAVENWPRAAALAAFGLAETKKPRQRALTGRKSALARQP